MNNNLISDQIPLYQRISTTERWFITCTVMFVTIIEILDMTIVNVALPHMMGQFEANSEQITWILTSYIVSSAIIMPLTGFLVARLGKRNLLLIDIAGFLGASMMCGLSSTLSEIVFFRTLQGIFGASLVPLSQYVLNDIFSPEEKGKAMAIWGIGIMVAPILGPTLGGYITETLNWRWVFYINVPVCIIAFFMTMQSIAKSPIKREKVDWIGLILMSIGIGALQIFLDRGNTNDWWSSKSIVILCVVWIIFLGAFFVRGFRVPKNIINLNLLKNRNFSAATLILTIFGASLFGGIALIPIMLENLMGYSAELTGLFMAPRAITTIFGMLIASKLVNKVDIRYIVTCGILTAAYGSFLMSRYSLLSSFDSMIWPTMLLGFGSGLFFVPLSTSVLNSLSAEDAAEGSGMFNFGRSIGGSIGISLVSTLVSREMQINWNELITHTKISSETFHQWLALKHLSLQSPVHLQEIVNIVARNATMIGFLDAYYAIAISLLLMLPLVFVMKKPKKEETLIKNHLIH